MSYRRCPESSRVRCDGVPPQSWHQNAIAVRLAPVSGTRVGRVLVDRGLPRYPEQVAACDGEDLCSRCESAWFLGADQTIHRRIPRIVFGAPSMARTSPRPWALRSRDHVVPDPFVVARGGRRAAPARARHAAGKSALSCRRSPRWPCSRLPEAAPYRACVPRLGSTRRPVVVRIYSGSPDQEYSPDSENEILGNTATHVLLSDPHFQGHEPNIIEMRAVCSSSGRQQTHYKLELLCYLLHNIDERSHLCDSA